MADRKATLFYGPYNLDTIEGRKFAVVDEQTGPVLGYLDNAVLDLQQKVAGGGIDATHVGADGTPLMDMGWRHTPIPRIKTVQTDTVVRALLQHLGLEVVVNEAVAHHPVQLKAKT
jgi:hypothetical protein